MEEVFSDIRAISELQERMETVEHDIRAAHAKMNGYIEIIDDYVDRIRVLENKLYE